MTFCLGITVEDGLVGIADTRLTSGTELISAHKASTYEIEDGALFIMTSGLRSVRDKALTYFEEQLDSQEKSFDKLYKVANALAIHIRAVAKEDKEALEESGLHFNIHALMGGQCKNDKEHKLFQIYPQGNWVEVGDSTPYHIIGEGGYGKPVLDRTLKYSDSLRFALKVGCLAFDSTRISASDVDFPIDVVLYAKDSFQLVEHRFEQKDLTEITAWWQERLRNSVYELPSEWIDNIASQLTRVTPRLNPLKTVK